MDYCAYTVWHSPRQGCTASIFIYFPVELRLVTMDDLVVSCREEVAKTAKRMGFRRQDSETARMYN